MHSGMWPFCGEHVAAGNAFLFYAGYLNLIFIADFRCGPRVKFLAGSDHGDIRFADRVVGDSRVEFINLEEPETPRRLKYKVKIQPATAC